VELHQFVAANRIQRSQAVPLLQLRQTLLDAAQLLRQLGAPRPHLLGSGDQRRIGTHQDFSRNPGLTQGRTL
jgi:hypothetical protein